MDEKTKEIVEHLLSKCERLENKLKIPDIWLGESKMVCELKLRIKELEERIETHRIETWKLVNKINHPITDADIVLWKNSEITLIKKNEGLKARIKELEGLVKTQKEYAQLLVDELNEVVPLAIAHGWKSSRYEEGKRLRKLIEEEEK